MKTYNEQFEPYMPGFDVAFEGVGYSNVERKKHLYPYGIEYVWHSLNTEVRNKRVELVDKVIRNCIEL